MDNSLQAYIFVFNLVYAMYRSATEAIYSNALVWYYGNTSVDEAITSELQEEHFRVSRPWRVSPLQHK